MKSQSVVPGDESGFVVTSVVETEVHGEAQAGGVQEWGCVYALGKAGARADGVSLERKQNGDLTIFLISFGERKKN